MPAGLSGNEGDETELCVLDLVLGGGGETEKNIYQLKLDVHKTFCISLW